MKHVVKLNYKQLEKPKLLSIFQSEFQSSKEGECVVKHVCEF